MPSTAVLRSNTANARAASTIVWPTLANSSLVPVRRITAPDSAVSWLPDSSSVTIPAPTRSGVAAATAKGNTWVASVALGVTPFTPKVARARMK